MGWVRPLAIARHYMAGLEYDARALCRDEPALPPMAATAPLSTNDMADKPTARRYAAGL
ncbi:MAG: hypothetical protein NVSMB6_17620 [Burkholderiaceae bacterium]